MSRAASGHCDRPAAPLAVPPECSGERSKQRRALEKAPCSQAEISSFLNVATSIFWALSPMQVLQFINWQLGSNISLCRFYLLMMSLRKVLRCAQQRPVCSGFPRVLERQAALSILMWFPHHSDDDLPETLLIKIFGFLLC